MPRMRHAGGPVAHTVPSPKQQAGQVAMKPGQGAETIVRGCGVHSANRETIPTASVLPQARIHAINR